MNKKALSLAIIMALAIPTASNALSLGEIESKSSLNQPFQGKINLLSTSVAEAQNLRVRVASPDVFNRVGIDRPAFLNSIRFKTTVQNGRPVILVSSNQPINEPFLNFLLEVSWPNGQLLKEYTVLLDPPVLMNPNTAIASNNAGVRAEPRVQGGITRPTAQQQAHQAQQARQAQQQAHQAQQARQAQQQAHQAQQVRRIARAAATQVRHYRVRKGDTLSKIASNLGYKGIRKNQMMIALFEKNRRAFSQHNMNNLKAGALLTRPSLEEARSLSPRAAKSQVIAQARAWKQRRAERLAKKSGKTTVAGTESARMEVMGKSSTNDVSGTGSGKGLVAKLNNQLVLLAESLTTKQQENQELKSQVGELESLLRKKNRLITLKSEQLTDLQVGLSGTSTEAVETDSNGESITTRPVSSINEGEGIQNEVASNQAHEIGEIVRTPPVETNVEPVAAVEPEPKPTSAFKQDVAEESFDIMGLISSPIGLSAGLGSLALLGGLVYLRRRKSNSEEIEDFSNFIDDELNEQAMDNPDDSAAFDNNDMIDEPEFVMHDEVLHREPVVEENESELDDLIQEADVYIVYGLHDQAESEIKRAIDNYPANAALHAKLLENYKAAGNKEAFEEATKVFITLEADDKQNYWDEICEWGNILLPESKLYDSSALTGVAGVAMVAGTAVAATADKSEEMTEEVTEAIATDDLIEDTLLDEFDSVDINDGVEDSNLDEDDDSLDNLLDAEEDKGLELDEDHNIANLNLELDSDDFDKIMPESHAYKATADNDLKIDIEDNVGDDLLDVEEEDNLLADVNDNLSFLDLDDDEVIEETQIETKIDLAKAYIDMGDIDGARSTLEEVMEEGSEEQKRQAEELLHQNG